MHSLVSTHYTHLISNSWAWLHNIRTLSILRRRKYKIRETRRCGYILFTCLLGTQHMLVECISIYVLIPALPSSRFPFYHNFTAVVSHSMSAIDSTHFFIPKFVFLYYSPSSKLTLCFSLLEARKGKAKSWQDMVKAIRGKREWARVRLDGEVN